MTRATSKKKSLTSKILPLKLRALILRTLILRTLILRTLILRAMISRAINSPILKSLTLNVFLDAKHFILVVLGMVAVITSNTSVGETKFDRSDLPSRYDNQWYLGGGSGISDPFFAGVDNGLRLDFYTGIEVSNEISVEAGVIQLGEFDTSATNSLDINGATIALRGVNRMSRFFSLYVKLGILAWRSEPTLFFNGSQLSAENESGRSLWLGFGFAFHLGEHFTILAGADHFSQVDEVDINSYSSGIQFSF